MGNWVYIDDIKVTNNVNTIHCDTRDFHCSILWAKALFFHSYPLYLQ